MATAVDSIFYRGWARPHNGESSYLHYWDVHAAERIAAAGIKSRANEYMLLESAKRKLESAKQEIRDAAAAQGVTKEELTELEKVLTGKIFENAGDVLLNSGAIPPSFQKLLENQGSSNLNAAISDLQKLAGEIQAKVLDKIGQNQSFAAKYAELLQAYFMTGDERVGRFSGKTYTEWQQTALAAILSREGQGFFGKSNAGYKKQKDEAFTKLTGDESKLLAAATLLSDPEFPNLLDGMGSVTVKHGDTPGEVYTAVGQQILEEFLKKVGKCLLQLDAVSAEAAAEMGFDKLLKELETAFENLHHTFGANTGASKVQVVMTHDDLKEKLFNKVHLKNKQSAWQNFNQRTSKSDSNATVFIGENGAIGSMGLTVKSYKHLQVNSPEGSATLEIQKGTPLLTLLAREAGFSGNDILNLLQVAAAHSKTDEGRLVRIWNDTVQMAKYAGFLETLAGFTSPGDRAFYMVLNGKIFDINDILTYVQRTASSVRWNEVGKGNAGNPGLQYDTYHNLTEWRGRTRPHPEDAETRSSEATQSMLQRLYDTKIRVSLNLVNFIKFKDLSIN